MRISPISFAGKTTRSAYARKTTPSSTSNSVAEASTGVSDEKIVECARTFVDAFNNLNDAISENNEANTVEQPTDPTLRFYYPY